VALQFCGLPGDGSTEFVGRLLVVFSRRNQHVFREALAEWEAASA
jgi:hypothetical protein